MSNNRFHWKFPALVALFMIAMASLVMAMSPEAPPAAEPPAAAITAGLSKLAEERIDLAAAFPDVKGAQNRTFRAGKIQIAPGGSTAIVSRNGAPAVAFVDSGAVLEHRSDSDSPRALKKGEASFAKGDVSHRFENKGAEPAIILIVDIIPNDQL